IFLTEADCNFSGQRYSEGDIWYPIAGRIGAGCVNCTCINDKVNCTSRSCPELKCESPTYRDGACCPVCEDFGNIIPTVDPQTDGSHGHVQRDCLYFGKTYTNKQIFASNQTALKPTNANQCVNCVCQSGSVFCYLKTCIIPKNCKNVKRTGEDCCPQCLDCIYKEEIRNNGSSWSILDPVTGVEDPCVTCTCMDGQTSCKKEVCPVLTCKRQRKRKGQCCPKCRKNRRNKKKRRKKKGKGRNKKKKNRRRKNKNKNKGKNRNTCKKKKRKNRGRNSRRRGNAKCVNSTDTVSQSVSVDSKCTQLYTDVTLSSNGSLPCFLRNLCLPGDSDFIIYRHLFRSGHLMIAFDDVAKGTVEAWTILPDNSTGRLQTWNIYEGCNADIFRRHVTSQMVLGASRGKILRKFKRKLGASGGAKSGKSRGLRKCLSGGENGKSGKRDCRRLLMRQMLCADFDEMKLKTCR
ncbi:hypothetical protein FSP39_013138, partial [Pinctada imbricata]